MREDVKWIMKSIYVNIPEIDLTGVPIHGGWTREGIVGEIEISGVSTRCMYNSYHMNNDDWG